MKKQEDPDTFDWRLYANATFAGLAVLIPFVPLDLIFEWYFRRRMARSIARRQGVRLSAEAEKALNRQPISVWGCLAMPFQLVFTLLKKLSRKLLYFLTVKEATDKLSHYWHKAYLLDYMVRAGHVDTAEEATAARQALDEVLDSTTTSPLYKLALEVVENARHVLRSLRGVWRRGEEDEVVAESRSLMGENWAEAENYLAGIAARYQTIYERIRAEQQIRLLSQKETGAPGSSPVRGVDGKEL